MKPAASPDSQLSLKQASVETGGIEGIPVFRVSLNDPLATKSIVISKNDFSADELEQVSPFRNQLSPWKQQ